METLTRETLEPSQAVRTTSELTDEDIYGAQVPETVLAQRQFEQERSEENIGRHAENIVYGTEIVDYADSLLGDSDTFSHNEKYTKDGVDKFAFGSFDIKRVAGAEGTQDYAIRLVTMGAREPQRADYTISLRNGQIQISTHHENAPSMSDGKPQPLDRDISWNTDEVMDPNDLVKSAGENETRRQLALVLDFMVKHSEAEHETSDSRKKAHGLLSGIFGK